MKFTYSFQEAVASSDKYRDLTQRSEWTTDNSRYTDMDACTVKGIYTNVLKRTKAERSVPLIFGGAAHKFLEAHLKGKSVQTQIDIAKESAIEAGILETVDDRRNLTSLEELVRFYNIDYVTRIDKFKPLSIEGELMVEKSFRLPFGSTTVRGKEVTLWWEGRIDLIAECVGRDGLWVVDHKTTSVMGEQFAADQYRSSQMLGYMWAAMYMTKFAGGNKFPPINGVIVNAIAIRKRGFECRRYELPFAPWAVFEWQLETIAQLGNKLDQIYSLVERGEAVPTRTSCVTKYGKCDFFDVCELNPNIRHKMLENTGLFAEDKWSPLT